MEIHPSPLHLQAIVMMPGQGTFVIDYSLVMDEWIKNCDLLIVHNDDFSLRFIACQQFWEKHYSSDSYSNLGGPLACPGAMPFSQSIVPPEASKY